jgi:hypothetical protein
MMALVVGSQNLYARVASVPNVDVGPNPQAGMNCNSPEFSSIWSSVVKRKTVVSGDEFRSSYRIPVDGSGNAIYATKTSPRAGGGFNTYFPWGSRKISRTKRNTVFFSGGMGTAVSGGYCFEYGAEVASDSEAPSMAACKACLQNGLYGWQVKIHSMRNLETEKLKNPVLIVQGFDFGFGGSEADEMSFASMEKVFNTTYSSDGRGNIVSGIVNPLDRMVNSGYDVVLVRFRNPNADISEQGKNLLEAMQKVREFSANAPLYLIGPSMGGQVVRVALAKLQEKRDAKDPSIQGLHVSGALLLDSPNKGAAIPASVFFAIRSAADFDVISNRMWSNMNSEAANQMLYETSQNDVWIKNSVSEGFYNGINSDAAVRAQRLNGEIDLVAVANGGGTGIGQGLQPGKTYFQGDELVFDRTWTNGQSPTMQVPSCVKSSSIFGMVAGVVSCAWDHGTMTINNPAYLSIQITERMNTKVTTGATNSTSYTPFAWGVTGPASFQYTTYGNGGGELENSPGGRYPMFQIMRKSLASVYSNRIVDDVSVNYSSFIPAISASGILSRNLGSAADLINPIPQNGSGEKTLFSRIYMPSNNQPHCSLTPQNTEWIVNEIQQARNKWNAKRVAAIYQILLAE